MDTTPENPALLASETNIKSILGWLALAHGRTGSEDADQLSHQLLLLRETAVPTDQRIKLLDLLYGQAERIVEAELPQLREVSLPVSRKIRQRVRALLDLLETLTQDYFNTLAEMFDPLGASTLRPPHTSIRKAMHAISWQINISHLLASPTTIGIWQQLHAAFRTAKRIGQENFPGPAGTPSIQRVYTNILLAAIAQPASFSSAELEFIRDYIERSPLEILLLKEPPPDDAGVFWIDLERDFPAHALVRRGPPPDTQVLYFSCDEMARRANQHRTDLQKGVTSHALDLPVFAETHAGKGVLQRLASLWGQPAKRRFPRRRQSYRANLCSGLDQLWRLMKTPGKHVPLSEWMVTNESPDGYALMHMSGHTENVRVGDIVALQSLSEDSGDPVWRICIIRWAISENPEHVELGLQLLSPHAIAAEIAQPGDKASGSIAALILPKTPPLRMSESMVVPAGVLRENTRRIVVLVEKGNLEVRQVRATRLDEQTSSIDVFSVSPDDLS